MFPIFTDMFANLLLYIDFLAHSVLNEQTPERVYGKFVG